MILVVVLGFFQCLGLLFNPLIVLIFFLDFVRGPYGKGLYFSMQACQAAAFSAVNFLVKVVYLRINRAILSIPSPMFSPPPWMSRREPWDGV